MDFSCGVSESQPADSRDTSIWGSSDDLSNSKFLRRRTYNRLLRAFDNNKINTLFSSQGDHLTAYQPRTTIEDETDSWTISSLSDVKYCGKEDDDSDLTVVTPLSSYTDDQSLGSSTLSEISSLISWADGYLGQFDSDVLENIDSSSYVIDLQEISHLIIDGIIGEILSQ